MMPTRARKLVFIYQNSRLLEDLSSFNYLEAVPEWTPEDLLPCDEEGDDEGYDSDGTLGAQGRVSLNSNLRDALLEASKAAPLRRPPTTSRKTPAKRTAVAAPRKGSNRFKNRRVTAMDYQDERYPEPDYNFDDGEASDDEEEEYEDKSEEEVTADVDEHGRGGEVAGDDREDLEDVERGRMGGGGGPNVQTRHGGKRK